METYFGAHVSKSSKLFNIFEKLYTKLYLYCILFSLFIIFFLPNLIRSQEILYISFGEKIVIGKIGEKYNYKIEYRNTSKILTHSELNNYIFESPGNYQIFPQEIITEKYFGR